MKKTYMPPVTKHVTMQLETGVMNTATLPVVPTDQGVDIWDAEGKQSGSLWDEPDDEEEGSLF